MRVVALVALLALASASSTWNVITRPTADQLAAASATQYYVSQIGPRPGATTISQADLDADTDVRGGSTKVSAGPLASTVDFVAPYSGCYYQYTSPSAGVYKLLAGPLCTTYSEYNSAGNLREAAASVSLHKSASTFGTSGGKYTFSLKFSVDAGYAGVAFEFLNMNVANPTDADTRCGVAYDDIAQPVSDKLVSPHSSATTINIINPAGHTYSQAGHPNNGDWDLSSRYPTPTYTDSTRVVDVSYTIADFNTALQNCGWKRDESNQNTTLFKSTIRSTTVQQGRSIRGVLYKSIKETAIQVAIAFSTAVNASSVNLDAQSNVTTISEVLKQVFDPTTFTAYLLLYTSSQGPYQLQATGAFCDDAVNGNACLTWGKTTTNGLGLTTTTNAINFDALLTTDTDNLKITGTRQGALTGITTATTHRAKCWPVDALTSASAPAESDMNKAQGVQLPLCGQFWTAQINVPSNCPNIFSTGSTSKTLNGAWKFTFDVHCHPTYPGSCATPLQANVTVYANTASDDYCARIVDTVSASATLKVYQNVARAPSDDQDQFVFGTSSFFTAEVTSTIGIEALYSEEVAITLGGAADNHAGSTVTSAVTGTFSAPEAAPARQILYANGYNSVGAGPIADTYFGAVEDASSCAGLSGQNTLKSDGTGLSTAGAGFSATPCYFASTNNPSGYKVTNWNIQQYNKNTVTGAGGSPVLKIQNYFQWQWDASTSNATGDFAQTTVIRWLGRIRYDDATQKHHTLAATIMPNNFDLLATSGSSASVSRLTSGAPSQAAPQEAVVSTTTIAVAAAAVAAVAVMAVAAVVVLRSRNVKAEEETNLESVTLGSSSVNLAQ